MTILTSQLILSEIFLNYYLSYFINLLNYILKQSWLQFFTTRVAGGTILNAEWQVEMVI